MGGFGAVNLAIHHPDKFAFVGALSAAIDVPRRRFTWRRPEQSRRFEQVFGPDNSDLRRTNDPFLQVAASDPKLLPYFYMTCGQQEGLLPANREFAALLNRHAIAYEFHLVPGGHNWDQWNAQVPAMFEALKNALKRGNPTSNASATPKVGG
jgi:putative tributyrin esterase